MELGGEMVELFDGLENIRTRDDLQGYILELAEDVKLRPDAHENISMDRFLFALSGWMEDLESLFRNFKTELPVEPSWKLFALMMKAGLGYE